MFKKLFITLFSASLLIVASPAEAGLGSKIIKGAIVYQGVKQGSKLIAKKTIKNAQKDSTKPLLKNELKVDKYSKLKQNPEKGLDYHHIPSTKQIEKSGIKKGDGIAIGTQHDRHGLTRTYKNGNKEVLKQNEKPREALARDIADYKKISQDNGLYGQQTRDALKEVIKQNKEKFPNLYNKTNK